MADKVSIIEGLDGGANGGSDKFGAFSVRVTSWLDKKSKEYVVGWSILPDGVYYSKALDKVTLGALQRGGVDLTSSPDLVSAIARARELVADASVQQKLIRERVLKDLGDPKRAKDVPEKYRKALSVQVATNPKPAAPKTGIAGLDD